MRFLAFYFLSGLILSVSAKAALLSLSKTDHTLAIVDGKTLKVLDRVPVGPDPHEVVASTDGTRAYVSNTGSGQFHELNVIDLLERKALPNIDTGTLLGPHGLFFSGAKLWFTAEGAKAVGRFDPTSATIDWQMGTGQDRTHMIYVTSDDKTVYVTNVDSSTVSILENKLVEPPTPPTAIPMPKAKPRLEWLETVIPVGKGSEGFDVSPDGKELWTAAAHDGTVSIIDLEHKKVATKLVPNIFGANRLKFTPDGQHVLVSSLKSGDVFVFETKSHKVVQKIHVGTGAAGILMEPNGARAFIGCTPDNYVAVIDLKKLEMIGHIETGGRPDGLAWVKDR